MNGPQIVQTELSGVLGLLTRTRYVQCSLERLTAKQGHSRAETP